MHHFPGNSLVEKVKYIMKNISPVAMRSIPNLNTLQSSYLGLKGLLFDMDGTLFDTEKYHTLALQKIGIKYNIVPPCAQEEIHRMMIGKADHLLFEIVRGWPGFPNHWEAQDFVKEKNEQLIQILSLCDSTHFIHPKIIILLQEAQINNLQTALVTSSEKIVTNSLLKISGLDNHFDYVLTRDDSLHVKPHPWPYMKAMQELKIEPQETLIFEDSLVGLEAALASNAHVIKAEWY